MAVTSNNTGVNAYNHWHMEDGKKVIDAVISEVKIDGTSFRRTNHTTGETNVFTKAQY